MFNGDKPRVKKRSKSIQERSKSLSGSDGQSRICSPRTTTSSDGTLTPSTPWGALQSAAANRMQLYSTFMDIWIPSNILPQERGRSIDLQHFGYLRELASMPSSHPALSSSMDALSLVSTGSLYRDKQLLWKAIDAYAIGLNKLASALAKPGSLHDDSILATIMILLNCEVYDEIRQQGHGWIDHQNGLQRLIAARGPESINGQFSSLLLANAKTGSWARSLLSRRTDFHDSEEWRGLELEGPSALGETFGHDVGLKLPSLLEQHDRLNLGGPTALQDIDALLSDCARLEHDFRSYLDHMICSTKMPRGEPFVTEDIESFSTFSELVSDRTLKKAHRFPSFGSAYLHSSFWLRMHFLRTTMRSLHSQRAQLLSVWRTLDTTCERPVSEDELWDYIMNLCRCIPFFIEPENGTVGNICCFFPLLVASKHFEQHGDWDMLKWVHNVRCSVFNKGLSMPVIEGADIPMPVEK